MAGYTKRSEHGKALQFDPQQRWRRNGRDLGAYTHLDVLYQAYFTALLTLGTIGTPLNPGNPYVHSTTQNGFGTLGGPDFAACLGEIACKALNAVWYQKWLVHLRPRPEATGGQVHLVKTGQGAFTDVVPNATILNSAGLQTSFNKIWDLVAAAGVSLRGHHTIRRIRRDMERWAKRASRC